MNPRPVSRSGVQSFGVQFQSRTVGIPDLGRCPRLSHCAPLGL